MESALQQIRKLNTPYPQRRRLELEVIQDFELDANNSPDWKFSESDLADLTEIHSSRIHKFLSRLKQNHRFAVEFFSTSFPLILAVGYIIKEDFMINFIQEGGLGMYAILLIGGFLLIKEMLRLFLMRGIDMICCSLGQRSH